MNKPLGPDKRLNPYRADLAAAYLRGEVEAAKFVDGDDWQVTAPRASLLRQPEANAAMDTELLFGETFRVYEQKGDWCWGQSTHDDYVGYVSTNHLARRDTQPTHRVVALRTFRYPEPNFKTRPVLALSMNAKVAVTGAAGKFVEIAGGGYVAAQHLAKLDAFAHDYVSIAEEFLGVPYLWGGRDARGLDCSGLVQMALERCGIACLRDTDLQEATLGERVGGMADIDNVQRGDLIFWRGHVGIMADAVTLLHANATHMRVARENFREAVNRIEKTDGPVTSIRRLQA